MRLFILTFAFLAPLSAQFPDLDLHQPMEAAARQWVEGAL